MKEEKDTLVYEREYLSKGYKFIAGMDEAGRGPLAGPVSCACVIMPLDVDKIISGVDDSKKLTEKKRDELYGEILKTAISYKIVFKDEKIIDEINILQATKQGMIEAYDGLSVKPDFLLIDAVKLPIENSIGIIHGDAKSYSIACASILAKVARDRFIVEMSKKYPEYGFEKHKGYGTKMHIEALKKYGKCPIHRETFIKKFVSKDEG